MSPKRFIAASEIGHLCIYLSRKDRMPARGRLNFLPRRSLAQHIVDLARRDGILNAALHTTLYGFTGRGDIETIHPDRVHTRLVLFVELVAVREDLERFVCCHKELLRGKVMVYKHLEQWSVKEYASVLGDRTD